MKCNKHPRYKAIHKPRKTVKNPDGCMDCWAQYIVKNTPKLVTETLEHLPKEEVKLVEVS